MGSVGQPMKAFITTHKVNLPCTLVVVKFTYVEMPVRAFVESLGTRLHVDQEGFHTGPTYPSDPKSSILVISSVDNDYDSGEHPHATVAQHHHAILQQNKRVVHRQ